MEANEGAKYLFHYLTQDHCGIEGFSGEGEVAAVTGEWRSDGLNGDAGLSRYTGTGPDKLPRILILTYQIAEAGVNLPGFNYVVNYHISGFPSALEQRFGRIDRRDSRHRKIHACYLLDGSSWWDTNTHNFHRAVKTALNGLIPLLPSRNAILSREILQEHIRGREREKKLIEGLERLLEQDGAYEAYQLCQKPGELRETAGDGTAGGLPRFFAVLKQNLPDAEDADDDGEARLPAFKADIHSKDGFARWTKKVVKSLRDYWRAAFSAGVDPERYIPIFEKFGNDIFYMPGDGESRAGGGPVDSLRSISLEECRGLVRRSMEKSVQDPEIKQITRFQEDVVRPWEEVLERRGARIGAYFCNQFSTGHLENMFPDVRGLSAGPARRAEVDFYRGFVALQMRDGHAQEDISALNRLLDFGEAGEYCFLRTLRRLPVFKMCGEFEAQLYETLHTAKGEPKINYAGDPFAVACWKVREQACALGLMPRDLDTREIKRGCLSIKIEGGTAAVCSWYQLAAKFFMEHQEFDLLSCFYSNWDWIRRYSPVPAAPGQRLKLRENVKWPWPAAADLSSLRCAEGDYLGAYFIDCFRNMQDFLAGG